MEYWRSWYKIRAVYKFSSVCMAQAITKHDANLVVKGKLCEDTEKRLIIKNHLKNSFRKSFLPLQSSNLIR